MNNDAFINFLLSMDGGAHLHPDDYRRLANEISRDVEQAIEQHVKQTDLPVLGPRLGILTAALCVDMDIDIDAYNNEFIGTLALFAYFLGRAGYHSTERNK